ncbi:hypothetical protein JCM18237_03320 [Halorubrum luteum]
MVVIAAVDRSDRSRNVVHEAVSLGAAFEEPVHVVHSMTRSKFVDIGVRSAEAGKTVDIDDVRDAAEAVANDAVENADIDVDAGETADPPVETVGMLGDPEEAIVDYAERQDARYVVVLGRTEPLAAKALFGSVAQSILRHAPCSVVTPSVGGSN